MTRLFSILFLFAALTLHASPGILRTNVTLAWNYPDADATNVHAFRLYSSTNIALPLTNWTVIATIPGTNRTVTLPIQPPQRFYTITASNWWGESPFSNVAATEKPPVAGTLGIGP